MSQPSLPMGMCYTRRYVPSADEERHLGCVRVAALIAALGGAMFSILAWWVNGSFSAAAFIAAVGAFISLLGWSLTEPIIRTRKDLVNSLAAAYSLGIPGFIVALVPFIGHVVSAW